MPIASTHPKWKEAATKASLTEDAFEGDVKDYVPKLERQSPKSYEAYVNRAAYYNVTERTAIALIGALMRKPYTLENVVNDEPETDNDNFAEFIQNSYLELMLSGRQGILVDFDEAKQSPKLVSYCAEDIINWSSKFIVIQESSYIENPEDPYEPKAETVWRELRLDEEGLYEVRLWKASGKNKYVITETIQPTIRGVRLNYIPFYWVTPYDNTTEVYNPPLYNLAVLNIQHFKVATDYSQGLHMLALPTPWIAGDIYTADGTVPKEIAIGTDNFLHLNQESKIGFLEFSGSGLSAIANQLTSLEEQMFNMGSRLLMPKKGIESAEALQIRAGSESAALETMTNSLENGLQQALNTYNLWAGSTQAPVIQLNRDFTASKIDPATMSSLIDAYTSKVITLDTLLTQLFQGEIVSDPIAEKEALSASPAVIQTASL